MKITTSYEEGRVPVTVLQIKGELSSVSSQQLVERAEDAVREGAHNLLLDLSGVSFLSSTGLRAIHQVFMLLRRT